MSTAGNLVFWATGSDLAALDARTGQELWSADIGGGAGSPVTYSIDGRQYVSIAAGRVSAVGAPYIWTFALDAGAGPAGTASTEWTTAAPEDVGLSSEVLARIGPTMQQFIDADRTAGIMTLVARRGEIVHWEAHGWRVLDEDPLERDDIFRIYSMTKPVTSVAAMMLVEEGVLSLDDELASVIPEFAGTEVYESGATRPPDRPILIRDLLTHTSGLTYGIFGDSPVDSMYNRALYGASTGPRRDLEGRVDVIASLPLVDDPGDRWVYSMSTDVLGRVVEVVSGQSLDDFFRERIFEPLGMDDTGFHVSAGKHDRFTRMYRMSRGGLQPAGDPGDDAFTRPATWFSGGGGLTSTATDYLRFARMLLGEGELDGVRLLQPETVREMTRNHLSSDLIPILPGLGDTGFGLGFAVPADEEDGAYWWSGVANTYFWIDPAEELVAFAWTQLQPFGGAPVDRLLRPIVQESILKGN